MNRPTFETALLKKGYTVRGLDELENSLIMNGVIRPFENEEYIDDTEADRIISKVEG